VKEASELMAARLGRNVVVTAGIHWDALVAKDLVTVQNLAGQLAREICGSIVRRSKPARSRK
jgi:hypothetical protein